MIRVKTPRLELIAATPELVACEITDLSRLPQLLEAEFGAPWPPPLNDEQSMRWSANYLRENPDAVGFAHWYLILADKRLIIGIGGCKGKPEDGVVEIGYSLFPEYQGRGLGTEAVAGLLSWIFDHEEVHTVIAETLPELTPSIRVLEKNGFRLVGEGSEPGVIRFGLPRTEYDSGAV